MLIIKKAILRGHLRMHLVTNDFAERYAGMGLRK